MRIQHGGDVIVQWNHVTILTPGSIYPLPFTLSFGRSECLQPSCFVCSENDKTKRNKYMTVKVFIYSYFNKGCRWVLKCTRPDRKAVWVELGQKSRYDTYSHTCLSVWSRTLEHSPTTFIEIAVWQYHLVPRVCDILIKLSRWSKTDTPLEY